MQISTMIIIVLFVILIWFLFFTKPKVKYYENVTQDDFEKFLSSFFVMFADGSLLIIKHSGSPRFIQFAKHIEHGKKYISFSFPHAEWSKTYFDRIKEKLLEKNIQYEVTETDSSFIPRFIDINYIENVALALTIAKITLACMELNPDDRFVVNYEGVHGLSETKDYIKSNLTRKRR